MDRDPVLRRIERDAVLACAGMALAALVIRRGDPDAAAGVVAGGLLIWVSYRAIKGGVDALVAALRHEERVAGRGRVWTLVKFFTRYAILGVAAYVFLVRWRVHPAGLIAGASSVAVAAALEAFRSARALSRSRNSR